MKGRNSKWNVHLSHWLSYRGSMKEEVDQLVAEWLEGDPEGRMFDVCIEAPELAWQVILRLVDRNLDEDQTALLAAGPMENLLARYGSAFIDRVEQEAGTNPRFNFLLGGVWQQEMPEEIWNRVVKIRKEVW